MHTLFLIYDADSFFGSIVICLLADERPAGKQKTLTIFIVRVLNIFKSYYTIICSDKSFF